MCRRVEYKCSCSPPQGARSPQPLQVCGRLRGGAGRCHSDGVLPKGKPQRRPPQRGRPAQLGLQVSAWPLSGVCGRGEGEEVTGASISCRFSFATDIARGMSYLHQHRICHGRLKSLNCVLDDRWVCKITGEGRSQGSIDMKYE